MNRTGVKVRWFRPLRRLRFGDLNHRTHRKVLITDEAVGSREASVYPICGKATRGRDRVARHAFSNRGPAVDGFEGRLSDNWAETDSSLYDATDRFPDQPKPRKSGRAVRSWCCRDGPERHRRRVANPAQLGAATGADHYCLLRA